MKITVFYINTSVAKIQSLIPDRVFSFGIPRIAHVISRAALYRIVSDFPWKETL